MGHTKSFMRWLDELNITIDDYDNMNGPEQDKIKVHFYSIPKNIPRLKKGADGKNYIVDPLYDEII